MATVAQKGMRRDEGLKMRRPELMDCLTTSLFAVYLQHYRHIATDSRLHP